jgi:hypothetical protein
VKAVCEANFLHLKTGIDLESQAISATYSRRLIPLVFLLAQSWMTGPLIWYVPKCSVFIEGRLHNQNCAGLKCLPCTAERQPASSPGGDLASRSSPAWDDVAVLNLSHVGKFRWRCNPVRASVLGCCCPSTVIKLRWIVPSERAGVQASLVCLSLVDVNSCCSSALRISRPPERSLVAS